MRRLTEPMLLPFSAANWRGILCRSESHRCTSGCVSVFVDEATEDAGAHDAAGLEVVHRGGVLIDVGWKLMS